MSETRRYLEIDVLKAVGVLAVILIHSVASWFEHEASQLDRTIHVATRFAVPAFVVASGFLYATLEPVPLRTTARRLRRILVPYLIASVLAQLWHMAQGEPRELSQVAFEFATGASFGPYYYVFVIVVLVCLTPLLAGANTRGLLLLWALILYPVISLYLLPDTLPDGGKGDLFWYARHPLHWLQYFLLGWLAHFHYDVLQGFAARHRATLAGAFAVLVVALVFLAAPGEAEGSELAAWLNIYASVALVFVVAVGIQRIPPWLHRLSDSSYAIYLFHLFFLYAAEVGLQAFGGVPHVMSIALAWAAGILGGVLLVVGARAALGARARTWLGA